MQRKEKKNVKKENEKKRNQSESCFGLVCSFTESSFEASEEEGRPGIAMEALLSLSSSFPAIFSICSNKPRNLTRCHVQTSFDVAAKYRGIRVGISKRLIAKALLDSATMDQLGLSESDIRNPTVSSSYRSSKLPKPNQTVLEAQARVCTGPTQTRPLSEDQALKVLDTILRSGKQCLVFMT